MWFSPVSLSPTWYHIQLLQYYWVRWWSIVSYLEMIQIFTETRLTAPSAGLGDTSQEMRNAKSSCFLFGVCGLLRDFRIVRNVGSGWLPLWISLWKRFSLGMWVGWGGVSDNHQAGGREISGRLMETQIFASAQPAVYVGEGLNNRAMVLACTLVFSVLPLKSENSVPPCVSQLLFELLSLL